VTDAVLTRAPVEQGDAERLREWYAELETREPAVVETLRAEGMLTETAFLDTAGPTSYLYVYMEAENVDAALAAAADSEFDVDEQHHAVLAETLAGDWEHLDRIGHFTNPDR
jgi:hypothetical protein